MWLGENWAECKCRACVLSFFFGFSNGYTKVIENEGLPNEDDPTVKGNLYINFKGKYYRLN